MVVEGVIFRINDTLFVVKDFSDLIQRHISSSRLWEPDLVGIIKTAGANISREQGNSHLVNVGAHIGTICVPCAHSFSTVTAFEPVRSNFDHLNLHKDINALQHLSTFNLALSDCEQTANVVFNPRNTGGTHVVNKEDIQKNIRHAQSCLDDSHTVNCVTLDSMSQKLDKIDVLVVDIEGHEDKFIDGAHKTIHNQLPVLIIEIWTDEKRRFENMPLTQIQMIKRIYNLGYSSVKQLGIDTFIFQTANNIISF